MDYEDEEIRKELHNLYWKEGMSLRKISKKLGIPLTSIYELFIESGLRTRTRKKANKLDWKQRKDNSKRDEKGRFMPKDNETKNQ